MKRFKFEFGSCFGTYNVIAGSEFDYSEDENNGALGVIGPHAFRILCGRHTAPLTVIAYALRSAPAALEPGWDVVAEADLTSEEGDLYFQEVHRGRHMDLSDLVINGPGLYRVRFHIRGRDASGRERSDEHAIEEHLFVIWPSATPQPDRVLTALDERGRRSRWKRSDPV